MRKNVHVPDQIWKGRIPGGIVQGMVFNFGGFKILIGSILLTCLILPCVALLVIRSTSSNNEAMVKKIYRIQVMILWKSSPISHDEALWPGWVF